MNGEFVRTPNYATEQFMLDIHHDKTTLIKAGLSIEGETDYVLPFHHHPFHKEHTHSYCLQVSTGQDFRLVIPVIELIRFYFGSSSDLIARLFHVPFVEDAFWVSATKDEHGFAHVDLAAGLSGYSASDVARIAFNVTARHAVKLISDSCIATSTAREKVYPKTFFPFTGETNLKISGTWIEQPDSPLKTFLVFKILSCSHSFPFVSLGYTMQRKHLVASGGTGDEGKQREQWIQGEESHKPLDNSEPSKSLGKKTLELSGLVRFPDLLHKNVRRTDPEVPATILCAESSAGIDSWSVGEGRELPSIRPVDFVDACGVPAPKSHPAFGGVWWSVVSALVDKLMLHYPEVQFISLDPRQRYPQISVMPRLVNEDGEIHPLCFITKERQNRSRYISVLRVADERFEELMAFPEFLEEEGYCLMPATLKKEENDNGLLDDASLLKMLSRIFWMR